MEFPFKFGSIDPYMQTLSVKKHEDMVKSDEENDDPIVIVNVRINGRTHHNVVIPVPKDHRPAEGLFYYSTVYFLCLSFMNRSGALSPTRATARKTVMMYLGLPERRTRHSVLAGRPPAVSRQRDWTRGLEQISRI